MVVTRRYNNITEVSDVVRTLEIEETLPSQQKGDPSRAVGPVSQQSKFSPKPRRFNNRGQTSRKPSASTPESQRQLPQCPRCGKSHSGECRRAASACFRCGQQGHMIRDCPQQDKGKTPQQAPSRGRVFSLDASEAPPASGTISGFLVLDSVQLEVLFDTGATHSVISHSIAKNLSCTSVPLEPVLLISSPLGHDVRVSSVYRDCPLQVDSIVRHADLLPMRMDDPDVILGMDWLSRHDAHVSCRAKQVIFGNINSPDQVFRGFTTRPVLKVISALKAHRLLEHG